RRPQRRATSPAATAPAADGSRSAPRQPAALARHAERSVGQSLQPRTRDLLAALLAQAVGAGVDLDQRAVDLVDGGLRLGGQDQVELALDGEVAALATFFTELALAGLHLRGQRVGLLLQRLRLAYVRAALVEQQLALLEEELVHRRAPAGRLLARRGCRRRC